MIVSVMGMQDMLEIFFFKECLRFWVKSREKFGNMNDDYTDQKTSFVFKSSSYLCPFMVGPRTFWTPLVHGGADKLGQNSFFYYGFVYGRIWLKFCKIINKIIIGLVPMILVRISVQKS